MPLNSAIKLGNLTVSSLLYWEYDNFESDTILYKDKLLKEIELEIEKNYVSNPKKYYKIDCSVEDLDWLYSHKEHYTYTISNHLISVIK